MFGFTQKQITTAILIIVAIWLYRAYKANKALSAAQILVLQADPFTNGAV